MPTRSSNFLDAVAHLYRLNDGQYQATSASVALPIMTADRLADFLETGKTHGQSTARREFRKWVREQLGS